MIRSRQSLQYMLLCAFFLVAQAVGNEDSSFCDKLLQKVNSGAIASDLPDWLGTRSSGVLLPVTSLPGRFGIGEIGPEAIHWLDGLHKAKQKFWQILPLVPTGGGDSPYSGLSAFAGNQALLSFDGLAHMGLLHAKDLAHPPEFNPNRIDYDKAGKYRTAVLDTAAKNFVQHAPPKMKADYHAFVQREKSWLDDYSLYMALSEKYKKSWTDWPDPQLVKRDPAALKQAELDNHEAVEKHKVFQYLFDKQWGDIRKHAHQLGIKIIGDMPIYVAHDSADTWAHQSLFLLDANGRPKMVSGVPPDGFSADGQLWGNPIYDWGANEKQNYAWWTDRIQRSIALADVVRIDHFRGFESYWEIPNGSSAKSGHWVKGPGAGPFDAASKKLGKLPVIAEDLGDMTSEVDKLRQRLGFPGMAVTQFGFGGDDPGSVRHRPYDVPGANTVIYTGTHDNETLVEHLANSGKHENETAKKYLEGAAGEKTTPQSPPLNQLLIAATLGSPAGLAILPAQDILGLGADSRLNRPGSANGNWNWRIGSDQMTANVLKSLGEQTSKSGR